MHPHLGKAAQQAKHIHTNKNHHVPKPLRNSQVQPTAIPLRRRRNLEIITIRSETIISLYMSTLRPHKLCNREHIEYNGANDREPVPNSFHVHLKPLEIQQTPTVALEIICVSGKRSVKPDLRWQCENI